MFFFSIDAFKMQMAKDSICQNHNFKGFDYDQLISN